MSPTSDRDPFREAERLSREPIRIRCLGMSIGWLLLIAACAFILWRLLAR